MDDKYRIALMAANVNNVTLDQRRELQITLSKPSITLAAANLVLDAAELAAVNGGTPMVIAVVDEAGELKAYRRMDGAALLSVGIATDKAYTAVAFGMPTHSWFEFIKDDPPLLHGIVNTPRLVVFGGGYPLVVDGAVVGGVGVSGGHYKQDMQVAEAGVAAFVAAASA